MVVEAAKTSGSLITARNAIELHKDLFVVPGGLFDEHYEGSNQLLVEGARCVTSYEQILAFYEKTPEGESLIKINPVRIPPEYQSLYQCLTEPKRAQQIAKELSCSVAEINSLLTFMEIEGYIKSLPGNYYIKQ